MNELEVVRVKALVRVPLRLLFRLWRERVLFRLRHGKAALERRDEIEHDLSVRVERAFLFGDGE